MIVTKLLLLLLLVLVPLAAIGERAHEDDATTIKTKTDWKIWKRSDGGNCLFLVVILIRFRLHCQNTYTRNIEPPS